MDVLCYPSLCKGKVTAPSSKSHTMRSLLLASLSQGVCQIDSLLLSKDTYAMIRALRLLGVQIEGDAKVTVYGNKGRFFPGKEVCIDAENSGQIFRFLTALSSLSSHRVTIKGDASMRCRPIKPLLESLSYLGVEVYYDESIEIYGLPKGNKTQVIGRDSQLVSALLLLAPFLKQGLEISVKDPGEKPWVDLTLFWLRKLGVPFDREGYTYFKVFPHTIPAFVETIGGDFSQAAFFFALGALGESVTVANLDREDPQGDKIILEYMQQMGAHIEYRDREVTVSKSSLKGGTFSLDPCIDALPILLVLGCYSENPLILTEYESARYKESNRVEAMCMELAKMGARIEEKDSRLIVYPSRLQGASLYAHKDHRVAMALSVAATYATGASRISGYECIEKSYPQFKEDLLSVGGRVYDFNGVCAGR